MEQYQGPDSPAHPSASLPHPGVEVTLLYRGLALHEEACLRQAMFLGHPSCEQLFYSPLAFVAVGPTDFYAERPFSAFWGVGVPQVCLFLFILFGKFIHPIPELVLHWC